MAIYQNRAHRLDLSFPLEFHLSGEVIPGRCRNLSESGLLGVFDPPLDLWTKGEVLLRSGDKSCLLLARVARVVDGEAGLAFAFRNEAERVVLHAILLEAREQTHLVGQPPF